MKNLKNLLTVIFIALLLLSCEKEKQIVKGKTAGDLINKASGQRIDQSLMEKAMNRFITLTLRDSVAYCNDYEAQDALLIMEAALNYSTSTPNAAYDEIGTDTVSFIMRLTRQISGEFIFLHNDMNDLWSAMLESAENAKNRVNFNTANSPFNIVVDLEFIDFNPDNTTCTQTAVIRVVTWVGNTPLTTINCTYALDWIAMGPYYFLSGGYGCGSNLGNATSWATREIQKRLGPSCRGVLACSYFSDVSGVGEFDLYNYYAAICSSAPSSCFSHGNVGGRYLWYGPDPYECLSPSGLKCETDGMKYLAACYAPLETGSNTVHKSIISYAMYAGYTPIYPYYHRHYCGVSYGKCNTYIEH